MYYSTRNRHQITNKKVASLISECIEIAKKAGYNINAPLSWASYKAVRQFGITEFDGNGKQARIVLNEAYFNNLEKLKETILHEIAHVIAGCKVGHGYGWKVVALRLSRFGGVAIKRTGRITHEAPCKYTITCLNCGAMVKRYKSSPLITNTKCFRCKICGGQFEVKKVN